jgi:hypothetical protein
MPSGYRSIISLFTGNGDDGDKMNTTKVLLACALTAVLLSGCGSNQAAQGNANQPNTKTDEAPAANTMTDQSKQPSGNPGTAMNPNQRTMMMTFQSLMMMDKTASLSITKEQAAKMLPLVQDGITKNELSADAQTNLLAVLTAEQKKFVDDNAANRQQRANGQGGQRAQGDQGSQQPQGGAGGQPPQVGQGQDGQAKQPPQGNTGAKGGVGAQGSAGGQTAPNPQDGQNGQGANRGPNIGQQFVELLQSKTK